MMHKLIPFVFAPLALVAAVTADHAYATTYKTHAHAWKISEARRHAHRTIAPYAGAATEKQPSAKFCFYRGGPKGTSWTCQ